MTIKQAFVAKKEAVKGFLGRNVIDDWNDVLRHAWSMRIVFGWTIIASVIFVAPMEIGRASCRERVSSPV